MMCSTRYFHRLGINITHETFKLTRGIDGVTMKYVSVLMQYNDKPTVSMDSSIRDGNKNISDVMVVYDNR